MNTPGSRIACTASTPACSITIPAHLHCWDFLLPVCDASAIDPADAPLRFLVRDGQVLFSRRS
jgi:hypothetical protein